MSQRYNALRIPSSSGGATTYTQTVSATLTAAATSERQAAAIRSASEAVSAALVRASAASRAAAQAASATLARTASATRSATQAGAAILARSAAMARAAAQATSASVSSIKAKLVALSASVAQAASVVRAAAIARSVASPVAATLARATQWTRAATQATSATALLARAVLRAVTATVSQSAAIVRLTGVARAASVAVSVSIAKSIARVVAALAGVIAGVTSKAGVAFRYGNLRAWLFDSLSRVTTIDARARAWTLSEDVVQILEKRTSEAVRFDLDFSQMLATGETIASVTSVTAAPAGLSFGVPVLNDAPVAYSDHTAAISTVVQVAISGGAIPAGAVVCDYTVRCKVATTVNTLVEGTAILRITDTP